MSQQEASASAAEGSGERSTADRLLRFGCFALGLGMIALALWQWQHRRGPEQTLQELADGLVAGNRAQVFSTLTAERRYQLEAAWDSELADARWQPQSDVEAAIHQLVIEGDRASAQLWLQKDGYSIKPEVTLVREADGRWLVDSITGFREQPRWELQQILQAHGQDEALADELSQALAGKPGVGVTRRTGGEKPF